MKLHEDQITNIFHYHELKKMSANQQVRYVYKWLYEPLVTYANYLLKYKYRTHLDVADLINVFLLSIPAAIGRYRIDYKTKTTLRNFLIVTMMSNMRNTCRSFFQGNNGFNYQLISYNDELADQTTLMLDVNNEFNFSNADIVLFISRLKGFTNLEKQIILYTLRGVEKKDLPLTMGITPQKFRSALARLYPKLKS
ncbi:Uncharacterised protein [Mycoplasmopsis californica]|uniref:Sigma-70 family RNA polymerase sigma factor n=1 Tax=Mycoplasmopsis equigenitalium TaxID=114883 RepID=A0ABY5J0N1_9BACT|nr:hypothetical protein [Mycoplasmopsis equigenitalium]UUD36815.1 hypothetical protein NPA09_02870 [Mycoplasmopsis equigenitalium]VEU69888.1 Uncharacterised protein [Mycoplasmopsis californica]